jgi:hypothetical protein
MLIIEMNNVVSLMWGQSVQYNYERMMVALPYNVDVCLRLIKVEGHGIHLAIK